jgi:sarcosine oxidase subunit alpha
MSQPFRFPRGGRIDRTRCIRFRFDGQSLNGFDGDTLASALLANGIHLVGRSFKYHRPRGIMTAGSEEPNALVQLSPGTSRTEPNVRATVVELKDGLVAESQNRWPSLTLDLGQLNDIVSPLFPAGFYYKTFMWPRSWWQTVYEPRIRKIAGLGEAPAKPDPDRYLHRHAHCDVLVIGGGPAGIAAALEAGRAGRRVILCDEQAELGGGLLVRPEAQVEGLDELSSLPEVRVLTRTTCTGYYDHNYLVLLERVTDHLAKPDPHLPRQRLWRVRAGEVVLATGAIERPLVFVGNDRPGVMLASAARSFTNRHAVRLGERAVVFTNNDTAYRAALDLHEAGIAIGCIVDARPMPEGPLVDRARDLGIRLRTGAVVTGTEGPLRVNQARVMQHDADGNLEGRLAAVEPCDLLLVSGGWNPNVSLFSQARGRLRFDATLQAFVPDAAPLPREQRLRSVGACAGDLSGFDAPATPLRPLWAVPTDKRSPRAKAFVDFQNDVTAKDLGLALAEGFRSVEHVKRYTTTGMGTDQGKTSNVNALSIVADKLAKPVAEVGTTTFRPPYVPLTFGAMVGHSRGELFDVERRTPMHDLAAERGAVFEDVGTWKRAWYFPKPGEGMHQTVLRECRTVRETGGILDASTLGKIDIQGRDARIFLNRVYTNAWSKLAPGQCRYGLMLKDDGMVFDDGVTACISDRHFHMTTTTGGAAHVLAWLEDLLQTEWPDLEVYLTSVTEQWATIAVNGPLSREILAPLAEDCDLADAAFPHMAWRPARVAGVEARIFRISFTGERAFEVNVSADRAAEVLAAILEVAEPKGVTLYGTEAMHVLRAEKGFIIVGQETDGTVTPFDLGMDWIVSSKKGDFIGKRGLARPDVAAPGRKQLVGLLTRDPSVVLEEGAQVVERPRFKIPCPMIGHVTSAYRSAALGRSIALALVADGQARLGQTLYVPGEGGRVHAVDITRPTFYDPEGARLHG